MHSAVKVKRLDIHELINNARRNEALLHRLQSFELQLLSCQSWSELLKLLLEGLPQHFKVDAVSIQLLDSNYELKKSMLQSVDIDQTGLVSQLEFYPELTPKAAGFIQPPMPWLSGLTLPLTRNKQYVGQLRLFAKEAGRFGQGVATDFMQHLAAVIAACFFMVKQSEEQSRLALTDPLTGVDNRRGLEHNFKREWASGLRHKHEIGVLMLDLDFFKAINDQYGHSTGDRVLKQLCQTLKRVLRPTDYIGRLGGEEFAIIMPYCNEAQMPVLVKRIQQAIRTMQVLTDDGLVIHITASGGYQAVMPCRQAQANLTQIITTLDTALYQAKDQGRDKFIKCVSALA